VVSSSIQALLAEASEASEAALVANANLIRTKLAFVISILTEWEMCGGLGCLPADAERLEWQGPQLDEGKKQEWVTVGRFGGDSPRE